MWGVVGTNTAHGLMKEFEVACYILCVCSYYVWVSELWWVLTQYMA